MYLKNLKIDAYQKKDPVCLSKKESMSAYPLRRSKRIDGGASYSSIAEEYEKNKTNESGIKIKRSLHIRYGKLSA